MSLICIINKGGRKLNHKQLPFCQNEKRRWRKERRESKKRKKMEERGRQEGGRKEGRRDEEKRCLPKAAGRAVCPQLLYPHASFWAWHWMQSNAEDRSRGNCLSKHKSVGKGPARFRTVFLPAWEVGDCSMKWVLIYIEIISFLKCSWSRRLWATKNLTHLIVKVCVGHQQQGMSKD